MSALVDNARTLAAHIEACGQEVWADEMRKLADRVEALESDLQAARRSRRLRLVHPAPSE